MIDINDGIVSELFLAMDTHKVIAQQLIDKLIAETNQPNKTKIAKGHYDSIQNAELFSKQKYLSGGWSFNVHGEHCLFENVITNQKLEVSLLDKASVGNLDPYFFYNFLKTIESFKHLTQYLGHPFKGTYEFFEDLEKKQLLTRISGVQFRRL